MHMHLYLFVFRSLAEEGKAMLEKEKTMLELELKQMLQKHSVDLDKKEHTISSVSAVRNGTFTFVEPHPTYLTCTMGFSY